MPKGYDNTIAALSTPRGRGGIAVIRINGEKAVSIANVMFKSVGGKIPEFFPSRKAVFGKIFNPDGECIDTGILTVYRSPGSYTGEDLVEISCHGGIYITHKILETAFEYGARPAEPGEFTKRAFINGKLTLTEAEAVGELIEAQNDNQLALANTASKGLLSDKIDYLSNRLTDLLSELYAAIDYPEEDIAETDYQSFYESIKELIGEIERLLSTYKKGSAVSKGVRCVIYGSPNVGKSSLYNLISGEDSAIVTEIEGTTRDILKNIVSFGGITLELIDTAGIRDSSNPVEKIGVEKANETIKSAELILFVIDSGRELSVEEKEMIENLPDTTKIAILNKTDRDNRVTEDDIKLLENSFSSVVKMSCTCKTGLDELEKKISELYDENISLKNEAVIWNARQNASLASAYGYLVSAKEGLERGDPVDAVCTLCESAASYMMELDGREVNNEIVTKIFEKFCVGK